MLEKRLELENMVTLINLINVGDDLFYYYIEFHENSVFYILLNEHTNNIVECINTINFTPTLITRKQVLAKISLMRYIHIRHLVGYLIR